MVRDRKWLDHVRTLPCLVTGRRGHPEVETVDPAHIGRGGTGIKSSDDEVIPLLHSVHLDCHQRGEFTVLSSSLGPRVKAAIYKSFEEAGRTVPEVPLREWDRPTFMLALRAYAREEYDRWLHGLRPFEEAGR